jgi:sensor histidine kinase YesM
MTTDNKQVSDKMMIAFCLITGAFIIYPRIIDLTHEQHETLGHAAFFTYRYLFFCILTWILMRMNLGKHNGLSFATRLLHTFAITAVAYLVYVAISLAISKHVDCFTGLLLFQFVVACLICTFTGHVIALYNKQRDHEREIERLTTENLQSRYAALANQINPHFFFNSLNGLAALVRNGQKQQTLKYITELSGVFRYILQSDKKELVPLGDELKFLDSFRYLQEIRYADKLQFNIHVPDQLKAKQLPVLSLLPLIENIVKHNMIDRENTMKVCVFVNECNELVVANPIYKKIDDPEQNGIGLNNLNDRFTLLTNKHITVQKTNEHFQVKLPLA